VDQKNPYVEICLCPFCGDVIDDISPNCPSCNAVLIEDSVESALSQLETLAIDSSLFICSNCGAFIGIDATNCNACGAKRTPLTAQIEISAEDDVLSSASRKGTGSPEIFLCNNCGAFLSENATECDVCGMNLQTIETEEFEEEEEEYEISSGSMAEDILHNEGSLFLCNACGAFVKPNATDCGICGEKISDTKSLIDDKKIKSATAEEKLSSPGVLYLCDKCGAFMKHDATECPFCKTKKEEPEIAKSHETLLDEPLKSQVSLEVPEVLRKPPKERKSDVRRSPPIPIRKVKRTEVIEDCLKLWLKKAVALKKMGRPKDALRALNHALNLSSRDQVVMLEKADLFYENKNYIKAAQLYKQILNLDSENIKIWNKLGNALYHMGHPDESLLCYEKSLTLDALNTEAMINKGYILMKQSRWDEAVKCVDLVAT
jgi:tetratricopeptide (TPR) repeat protein